MSEQKLEDTITLGGASVTISKLKAGKFYEAQKIVADMLKEAATMADLNDRAKSEGATIENGVGQTPDIEKLKSNDILSLVGVFERFPSHVAKFVAICAGKTEQELLDLAYPEEINAAFTVCIGLNNVKENLKNSLAPIKELGLGGDIK